jgi:ABC-type antimicrobial peptide transport system permease subunit
MLMGGFAALALLLSLLGTYGVLAGSVASRTREIGIRMALGGDRGHILRLVLGQVLRLAGIALTLGLPAALAVSGRLTPYLYGVAPRDPSTYGVAVAVLAGIALLAATWPARRASRVEPWKVLKEE